MNPADPTEGWEDEPWNGAAAVAQEIGAERYYDADGLTGSAALYHTVTALRQLLQEAYDGIVGGWPTQEAEADWVRRYEAVMCP